MGTHNYGQQTQFKMQKLTLTQVFKQKWKIAKQYQKAQVKKYQKLEVLKS